MKTSLFKGVLAVTLSAGLLMGWVPAIAFAEEDEAIVADVADEELGEELSETIEPNLSLREDLAAAEGEGEGLTDEEIDALVDEFVPGEGDYEDEDSLEEMATSFRDVTTKTAHRSEILKLKSWGITAGFNDGTFRPNATCKRGDMAAFLYRATKKMGYNYSLPTRIPSGSFSDVTTSTSHWREIIWCQNVGLSEGWYIKSTGKREFRPYSNIKRGDMAALMYRFAELNLSHDKYWSVSKTYFADVKYPSTSHSREILWMAAAKASTGWTSKGKRYFRPNSNVKRGDMAAFIIRTMDWCK